MTPGATTADTVRDARTDHVAEQLLPRVALLTRLPPTSADWLSR